MMGVRNGSVGRRALWRSRWAAIGAAVAVTLGGGGIFVANAASSLPSSVITITPERVLDSRPASNVGLTGAFQRGVSRKLTITGTVPTIDSANQVAPKQVVPNGATGVLLNVTVVCLNRPGVVCTGGFLSVRPGDATGQASTSSLNFAAGDVVPNSVQVGLPAAGTIDIVYGPYVSGAHVDVIVDIVGYLQAGTAGEPGPRGDKGDKGDTGEAGAAGQDGASGNAVAVTFQSTVTAVFGGGNLPAGVSNGSTVRFAADLPDATKDAGGVFPSCSGPGTTDTHGAGWSFTPVPYVLTYASGYKQFGQIDAVVICDGGFEDLGGQPNPWEDSITFFDGSNDVFEAIDFEGGWYAGPIPEDLTTAMLDIAQPALFDLTFYWGSWGTWGTYHYDYTTPKDNTIVTRSP